MKTNPTSDEIRDAVLRLVSYADLYNYAPSIKEICNDLPWDSIDESLVKSCIENSTYDFPLEVSDDGFLHLKGKDQLVLLRALRGETSKNILDKHKKDLNRLANLPYVRTIILSGAMAFENAFEDDDIDLFLIVQSNRLWLVDLYNLLVIRIWNEKILRHKRSICPNYIVEDVSMRLSEHDFFTAHQIKHMKPLYDEGCWSNFIDANDWVSDYFPSFKPSKIRTSSPKAVKRFIECLGDILGVGILNGIIYALRGKRLRRKKRLGLLKGSYSYRCLKANDSRRGAIAMMRLSHKLEKISSGLNGGTDSLVKNEFAIHNEIVNCMTQEEEKSIADFIEYYKNHLDPSITPRDKNVILTLPFAPKSYDKYHIWKRRSKNYNRVMGLIHELEPSGTGPVLDLGAGCCWMSRRLIEDGYRSIAYDACIDAPSGLATAEIFEKHLDIRIERYHGLNEDLPFKDNSFHGVIASASFHYSPNPKKVLSEIYRVLTRSGWAIIYDSPVFNSESDGEFMVLENKKKYDPDDVLSHIEYKPRWFIEINEFLQSTQSQGFDVRIIPTRILIQRIGDRIKNQFASRHRWSEFPIILITKKSWDSFKPKSLMRAIRYLHYRLFTEGKLKPSKMFIIDGIKLKVPSGIFHPAPFDSSRILLRAIRKRFKTLDGKSVLDMGTGSGIHAIAASKLGARVIAVDINPKAIETAKYNAELNEMGDSIRFVESDLFENLDDELFDLILFNPPFYQGFPNDIADKAWIDEGSKTIKRFIEGIPKHLTHKAAVLVIISNRSDISSFMNHCESAGLVVQNIMSKRVFDEVYHVFKMGTKMGTVPVNR